MAACTYTWKPVVNEDVLVRDLCTPRPPNVSYVL